MRAVTTIIAEDDLQNAEIINKFIERIDAFNVIGISQSLTQIKEMADIVKPDLILLDNYFPDGNGTQLLQHIRQQNLQIDIIMITASKDAITIRDAIHGGIFDYIIKPISYNRLENSLEKYLNYFSKLHNTETLAQEEIDNLLKRNPYQSSSPELRLPKGIDPLTLEKIRKRLTTTSQTFTAEELGKIIGMSRTTSRRYLEYLVSLKEVVADVNYGNIGRPERLYKKSKN